MDGKESMDRIWMEKFGRWNLEPGFWKLKIKWGKNEKKWKKVEKKIGKKNWKKPEKTQEKTVPDKIKKFYEGNNTSRQMHWRTAAVRPKLHLAVVIS